MKNEPPRTPSNERASPEELLAAYLHKGSSPEEIFGARVRRLRIMQKWSQQELAYRLAEQGIDWQQTTVAKTESATRPIRLNEAVALSRVFNVQLQALLTGPASREEFEALAAQVRETQDELDLLDQQIKNVDVRLRQEQDIAARAVEQRARAEEEWLNTRTRYNQTQSMLRWLRQRLAQVVLEEADFEDATGTPDDGPTIRERGSEAKQRIRERRGSDLMLRVTYPGEDALAAEIADRYRAGKSIRKLAQDTGKTYGAIHRMLTRQGVELRGHQGAAARRAARYRPTAAERREG